MIELEQIAAIATAVKALRELLKTSKQDEVRSAIADLNEQILDLRESAIDNRTEMLALREESQDLKSQLADRDANAPPDWKTVDLTDDQTEILAALINGKISNFYDHKKYSIQRIELIILELQEYGLARRTEHGYEPELNGRKWVDQHGLTE